jgi:hypothetical protein
MSDGLYLLGQYVVIGSVPRVLHHHARVHMGDVLYFRVCLYTEASAR